MKRDRLFAAVALTVLTGWTNPVFAQTTHIVTATGALTFSPADITISAGDTVRWVDLDPDHNVAQTDCPASSSSFYNGGFYSGLAGATDTFEVTFNSAGTFCYICEPHVSFDMFGSVEVLQAVPTMPRVGLVAMALLLGIGGMYVLRRRARPAPQGS